MLVWNAEPDSQTYNYKISLRLFPQRVHRNAKNKRKLMRKRKLLSLSGGAVKREALNCYNCLQQQNQQLLILLMTRIGWSAIEEESVQGADVILKNNPLIKVRP